ncbi:hypothetical protein D3C76_724640 [compost metagenome]
MRINHDADVDREGAFFRVEIQIDRHHLADFDAEEFHRGIDLEAAQGLVETQGHELSLATGRGEGRLLVLEQFVGIFLRGRFVVGAVFRRTERNAAHQQGRQGLGLDRKTIGADAHVNTAGVPESGVLGDVLVVGCVDEQFDVHPLAIGVQRVGHDLADRNLAVVDRRADIQ